MESQNESRDAIIAEFLSAKNISGMYARLVAAQPSHAQYFAKHLAKSMTQFCNLISAEWYCMTALAPINSICAEYNMRYFQAALPKSPHHYNDTLKQALHDSLSGDSRTTRDIIDDWNTGRRPQMCDRDDRRDDRRDLFATRAMSLTCQNIMPGRATGLEFHQEPIAQRLNAMAKPHERVPYGYGDDANLAHLLTRTDVNFRQLSQDKCAHMRNYDIQDTYDTLRGDEYENPSRFC